MIAWEIRSAEGNQAVCMGNTLDQRRKVIVTERKRSNAMLHAQCIVLFPVADKGYTLCNVANDGRLDSM